MPSLLPDPGEALRLFCVAQPELTALVGDRISVALIGDAPAIRYARIGGRSGYDEADPLLQVECWGRGNSPDDGSASTIGRTVVAVLPRMRGQYGSGFVAGAFSEGEFDSADPTSGRPRQIVTVRMLTYP